ncbi:MAG: protein phosphatase 2C domain-containing protein [Chloroflexi bacterium]|nr:protein phosphatase 2C domain-containing protein [Chloroflexota bacterium]
MLEVVCQGAPDLNRANEDSFIAYEQNDRQPRYVLAAIDGATSVAFYEPLVDYLRRERNGITPAALAASVTRDAILTYLGTFPKQEEINPRNLLLHANNRLRDLLDDVAVGIFDAEYILHHFPHYNDILYDHRKIRLFLPAAAATLVVIDTSVQTLYYGQLGDTTLALCYADGSVEIPGREATRSYDSALFAAVQQVSARGMTVIDVIQSPLIQSLNHNHRIFHNFVDDNGHTVPERGVGVINGLPELEDYIKTGVVSLQHVEAVMLMSDGFEWPGNPTDPKDNLQERVQRMWQYIRQHGVHRYLKFLRAEERADPDREKYPRFKLHDDATGMVLYLHND